MMFAVSWRDLTDIVQSIREGERPPLPSSSHPQLSSRTPPTASTAVTAWSCDKCGLSPNSVSHPKWTFKRRGFEAFADYEPLLLEPARRTSGRSKSLGDHRLRNVSPSPHRAASPRTQRYNLSNGVAKGPGGGGGRLGVPQSPASMRKWRSSASFQDGPSTPTRAPFSGQKTSSTTSLASSHRSVNQLGIQREPSFNSEEGYLRIYLRNRAVILYAPSPLREIFRADMPAGPPEKRLKLEWVYGYRGRDCRSNIFLLPTGELAYFTAAVVVLYHVEEQMQRHYLGHTDDVKWWKWRPWVFSMDVHPNRLLIASGQVSKQGTTRHRKHGGPLLSADTETATQDEELLPHVRVWDSISLQTQHVIGAGHFERAVSCLGFSRADGGAYLAVVDESYEHTLSIWDWQRRVKITETKVFSCVWHPTDSHLVVSCGKGQISFWTFDGTVLIKKMGIFEGRERPKYVLCVGFTENGAVISGDSNGTLSVWGASEGRVLKSVAKAHEGGVFSLCATKGGRLVSGGGKDRRLLEWDQDLNFTGREVQLPPLAGPVRHVAPGKGSLLIVGTTHNSILQGSLHLKDFSFLVQGHMDELWGLSRHPTQLQFFTCAYDKTLRLWDSISHTLLWIKELPEGLQCCAVHPSGEVVAVGTSLGKWYVIDAHTREVILGQTDSAHILSCLQYSPDGSLLALGTHDCSIYVYQVSSDARKYTRIGRCLGHSSLVTHLDWSLSSQHLRSNSADHDVLFWNAKTCRPLTSAEVVRDIQWATDTCTLSFNVAGIWPENSDGADVNSADRSLDETLLASADDSGHVKLFRYPCAHPKSPCRAYSGHSSQVAAVRFLCSDARLISIGGKDAAIFQWALAK